MASYRSVYSFWRYNAGDVFVIKPQNLPEDVQEVIDYFGWGEIADRPFTLETAQGRFALFVQVKMIIQDVKVSAGWLQQNTIRKLLTHSLDIFGVPKRYTFKLLSFFTDDENHKEKLQYLESKEGQVGNSGLAFRV